MFHRLSMIGTMFYSVSPLKDSYKNEGIFYLPHLQHLTQGMAHKTYSKYIC